MDFYHTNITNLTTLATTMNESSPTLYQQSSKILWSVVSPILTLIGLLGNTTAFLVLFKLFRANKSTFHLFLAVLSLNDMVVLLTGLSRYWILSVFAFDIRDESNASCKLQLYVIYTTMHFSAWILVSVTLQRCLIVARPTKYKQIYTPKSVAIQLGIIFIILSAIDFHYFFTNGIVNGTCDSLSDAILEFEEYVFVWVDLFILCIIPFTIMLLSNIYFMRHITQYSAAANPSEDVIGRKIRHSLQIIMRLTWLFLATNLPVSIFLIFDSYYTGDQDDVIELVRTVCFLIQYAGFSFNICLYVSVDPKFLSLLRKKARKLESSFRSRNSLGLKRKHPSLSRTVGNSSTDAHCIQTQAETILT